MSYTIPLFPFLVVITLSVSAQSLYKCPDPVNGVVKFSQTPCTVTGDGEVITVKPIPATGGSTVPASTEETERLQNLADQAGRERRLLEIDREINALENQISGYRGAMNDEIAHLQRKKQFASNNLAGAMWEQSVSGEMNAVANKYDALIRNNQDQVERLRKERDRLREAK